MSDLPLPSQSTTQQRTWDIATLVLPLLGLAPMLILQAIQVWSKPDTILLPFCWLVLFTFAYYERKSVSQIRWRVLLSYLFLVAALVTSAASIVYFSPWLANLALAFVFIGWALVRLVHSTFSRILALSMLALITLVAPFGLESLFDAKTNSLVVHLCSSTLDLFGIFHLYSLPYLALKDDYFEIAQLLGNFFSIRTMVAISIIVSLAWKRSFITTTLNILSAVVWAVLGKIIYLFTTAAFSHGGINITESFLSTLILVGLFFLFVIMMLATDGFWNALLSPIRAGDEGFYRSGTADFFNVLVVWPGKMDFQDRATRSAKASRIPSTLVVQPLFAISIGLLIALMIIPASLVVVKNDLILNRANYLAISSERIPDGKLLPDDFLPKQRQRQFRLLTSSGISGGSAKTLMWSYGGSGVETMLFLQFPVRGWVTEHAASFRGWKAGEAKMVDDGSNWPWYESTFEGQAGSSGLVLSSQLHTKGNPYLPTQDEMAAVTSPDANKDLFAPRIFEMLNPKQDELKPQTFFIQMRFQSETAMRPAEKLLLIEKYKEARQILTNKLLGKSVGAAP
jgi:hypothetical protein